MKRSIAALVIRVAFPRLRMSVVKKKLGLPTVGTLFILVAAVPLLLMSMVTLIPTQSIQRTSTPELIACGFIIIERRPVGLSRKMTFPVLLWIGKNKTESYDDEELLAILEYGGLSPGRIREPSGPVIPLVQLLFQNVLQIATNERYILAGSARSGFILVEKVSLDVSNRSSLDELSRIDSAVDSLRKELTEIGRGGDAGTQLLPGDPAGRK
jgi:hypothetical protein